MGAAGKGGEGTSFGAEFGFLESQENGLDSLRDGGAGTGRDVEVGAGAAADAVALHGKEPKEPENILGFLLVTVDSLSGSCGGADGVWIEVFEVSVDDRDLEPLVALDSSRLTSSREAVDIRCDVNKGDLGGGWSSPCPSLGGIFSTRSGRGGGVVRILFVAVVEDEEGLLFVRDLEGGEDDAGGLRARDVESGASSKVS